MAGKNSTELIFSESAFNKLMNILDKVEQKLSDIQKTSTNLKKSSTSITFKFSGLDSLDTFLDHVSRGKVNQFLDLVAGFEKLIGIGAKTASFGVFVKDLNQITGSNLKPLVTTLKELAGAVSDKETEQVLKLGKALRAFSLTGEKAGGSNNTSLFITDLAKSIKELSFLSAENMDTAAKNLSRFGNGLKNLIKTMSTIDNSIGKGSNNTAARIGVFFAELSVALKLVVKLQGFLGDGKGIRELSLTIERLGLGVAGLTKNLKDINLSSTTKLIAFLTSMAVAIRIVTKISGDAKKTQAVASLFTGLANLLHAAFTGFNVKGTFANAKIFLELQARINSIIGIIKSIKNVNFKDAAGIATVITAVGALVTAISNIGSGGEGTGNMSDASVKIFKDFIEALKDLNKIKVSESIGKALEGIGNIFANFEKADSIKSQATGFGKGLSDSVAFGFIKGTLILEIGKTIFRLFAELNPITLTAKFVTGMITVFTNLSNKINEIIANVVSKINEVGSNLTNFGNILNSTFGVGSILNSSGFQVAATFDDLANKSKLIGNLSEESLQQVLDVADAVGQKYPVSANQALQAIINLQKAGINAVPDIKAVISPIADLASLSDSGSIEAASNTIIQVISSFKQLTDSVPASFANASTAADILSRGADNSSASVESLAQGLANVGPTASSFGLTLEETVAVLATFEDRGIKGAEAGTQLKSMLTNLTRPTKEVKGELKKLGIEITDQQGNFLDINTIMNEFNHSFNDVTKVTRLATNVTGANKDQLDLATKAYASAQRAIFQYQNGLTTGSLDQDTANKKIAEYQQVLNNASDAITRLTGDSKTAVKITTEISRTQQQNFESIQTIFGTYGQAGAAILTSLGDDAIKSFIDQMGRLPTAAEKAQLTMQSFNGLVEQLRGSAETLLKNFFLPMIQDIFKPFVIGLVAIVNALLEINPEILKIISLGTAFAAIFATIIGTLSIGAGFFVSLGGAVLGLATSLASLGVAVIAGLGGFIVGLTAFIAVAVPVIALFAGLATGFRLLTKIFSENIGGAGNAIKLLGSRIGLLIEFFQNAATAFGKFLGLIFGNGNSGDGLKTAGTAIATFINGISAKILEVAYIFNQLSNAFNAFLNFFENGIDPSKSGLAAIAKLADNPFISFLLDGQGLQHSASGVAQLFGEIQDGVLKAATAFKTISGGIGDLFASFNDPSMLEVGKRKIVDGIGQLASIALKALQSIFGVDFSSAIAAFDVGDLSTGLGELITKAIDGVKSFLLSNRDTIKKILVDVFNFVFNPLAGAIGILDFLGLKDASKVLKDVQKTLSDVFGGIVDTIFNLVAGQDLKTALTNGFGAGISPVIKFAETLAGVIGNVIGFIQELLAALFPISDGAAAAPNLLDIVTGVFDMLTGALTFLDKSVLTPLRSLIRGIDFSGLTNFISDLFGQFVDFFNTLFSGDISGALGKLGGIGQSIFDAIKNLVAGVFNIDFTQSAGDVIARIASGIASLVSSAFGLVSGFLSGGANLANVGTGVIQSIIDAINAFLGDNPAQKFADLASGIVAGIGSAIVLAITTLGSALGVDPQTVSDNLTKGFQSVIDGIQKFFAGSDGIFTSFDTIFTKIKDAITGVLNLFTGGSADAGVAVFNVADALQGVFDFLSKLAGLALTGLGDSLSGIADFFKGIADLPANQLLLAVAGIAGAVGLIVVLANYATIMATVSSGLIGIATGLGIFVGAIAVLEVGKNLGMVADVFSRLLNLDISGAAQKIVEFFGAIGSGVVFDILGLFGINSINGETPATVNEKIRQVADFVKTKLDELGTTLSGLKDGADKIIEFLGGTLAAALRILGFAASLVLIPIQLVQGAVKAFTDMDEKKQRSLVEFLFALGASLLIINGGAILGAIATGLGLLVGSLLSLASAALAAALPILAIGILLVTLKSAVDNIDKLFNVFFDIFAILDDIAHLNVTALIGDIEKLIADIIDFIGSTLVDAFYTVAGFFGFTEVLGKTKDEIKTTLSQVVLIIKLAFFNLSSSITNFFQTTFDDFGRRLSIAAADLRLAAADAAARVRTVGQDPSNDSFFKAQNVFDPTTFNLGKLTSALLDTTIDQTALRDFAIKNADLIKVALQSQLASGDTGKDSLFKIDTAIQFVAQSNNFPDVIHDLFASTGPNAKIAQDTFITAVTEGMKTGRIGQSDADAILNGLFAQVGNGTIDAQTAINLLNSIDFSGSNVDPAKREALVKQLTDLVTQSAELAKQAAETNPTQVDPSKILVIAPNGEGNATKDGDLVLPVAVSVDPTVKPASEDKKAKFFQDVQDSFNDGSTTATITPDVPIAPVFTGVTNQEDVDKFKNQIDGLNTGLDTSNTKFTEFANNVNTNVDNLQILSDKVATTSTDMQSNFANLLLSFNTFKDGVLIGFNEIAGAIARVTLALSLLSLASSVVLPNITKNMDTLKTVFLDMGTVAKTAFDKAKESVNSLDAAIKKLIDDINYAITQAGQLQGVQVQGGRERGGPVWKGLFEVGENDKPELLFQNGKIFLISPTGGSVEPISPVGDATGINSSFGLQQPVPKANPNGGLLTRNETSITLTEGDIVLNISGGGVSQDTITKIQQTVRTELDNRSKSIAERLRTAGRS